MNRRDNDANQRLFGLIRALSPCEYFTNDKTILEIIEGKKVASYLPSLHETEILASFLSFLTETGVMELFKKARVLEYKRVIVPIHYLLLTYMTKILIGVPSMNVLPQLLFSHTDLMRIIGFNESLLEKSISRRGDHGRSREKKAPVPFSPQMLSNFIQRFSEEEIEILFNSVIKRLADSGVFPEKIRAFIDYVDLKTTSTYLGCGKKTSTTLEIKDNALVESKRDEYGFKLVALLDSKTRIPLAVKLLKIHEEESSYLEELLKTAVENSTPRSHITHLSSNKTTFTLEEIENLHPLFYMALDKRSEDYQKIQEWKEEGLGVERDTTINSRIITLTGLMRPPLRESTTKINAVVITEGHQKEFCKEKGRIFLTNDRVTDPLIPFKTYNQDSILNLLLYERKRQGWHLQRPPKKNERTMTTHAFLTMLTFGLTRAYREHSVDT